MAFQQQQMQFSQQHDQQQALCNDVLYDVLRRVDGATLAVVGCVNSSLRCVSRDEALWEELCSKRWPSATRDPNARALIAAVGGFRKFYADCSRVISAPEPRLWINRGSLSSKTSFSLDGSREPEQLPDVSPCSSNFASMVDVLFKGKVLFSKFVDGIPGAEDFGGWFLGCPFRLDLVESSNEVNSASLSSYEEVDQDGELDRKRYGKAWKEIWEGLKLSWILVNKKTKEVANLSSLSPIIGQRHWPRDGDFVLRYGSIVSDVCPAECCIVLKGRILEFKKLKITEISMHLKNVLTGEHLSGRFGLPLLEKAVASTKSRDQELVICRHRGFLKLQHEIKSQAVRSEKCSDAYTFAMAVVVAMFSMFVLFAR